MKKETVYRKCPECGVLTKNSDYCKSCGNLVNADFWRQEERKKRAKAWQKNDPLEKPNAFIDFFRNARNHKNPFIRVVATVIYSIWLIVFSIGAFFAYIIGYIAA